MIVADTFMFRDELAMLDCRLNELRDYVDYHVLVESPVTHRGVRKPLYYAENKHLFRRWQHKIIHVVTDLPDTAPWRREHLQRASAWAAVSGKLLDDDLVLICDVDEIPHPEVFCWPGETAAALNMRTYLFAVDWLVTEPVPPAAVIARAGYLRREILLGRGLGEVRDGRNGYPVLKPGGWHFSWLGGPEAQRLKLETATCHTEIETREEGSLIREGVRWRTDRHGGGLRVVGVEVDKTWPAWISERRCPEVWFRPREAA